MSIIKEQAILAAIGVIAAIATNDQEMLKQEQALLTFFKERT